MSNDKYFFQPPEFNEAPAMSMPPSAHAAWMLQLIETKLNKTNLPEDIKNDLIDDMVPLLNNAGMTKISLGQVKEFIGGFNELWLRYRIFKVRKKHIPQFNYIMPLIREHLIMNLNKSVEGWQGDHVFEQKTTYDVTQTQKSFVDKVKGFLGAKTKKTQTVEEYE